MHLASDDLDCVANIAERALSVQRLEQQSSLRASSGGPRAKVVEIGIIN